MWTDIILLCAFSLAGAFIGNALAAWSDRRRARREQIIGTVELAAQLARVQVHARLAKDSARSAMVELCSWPHTMSPTTGRLRDHLLDAIGHADRATKAAPLLGGAHREGARS